MGISKTINPKTKTYKDLYYLQSIWLQHYRNFCYCIDLRYEKRISQCDHLLKGCEYWQKKIGLYFLLKLRNYSSIKFFQVEIFNYVNKALFYTTQRNLFNYFNNYDSILLFHISIGCANFFCSFVGCTRIGFFNSNILENYKSAFLLIYFLYNQGVSLTC